MSHHRHIKPKKGAGFWDRGLGAVGARLSDAARAYGEVNLEVGDDGKIRS